MTPDEIKAALCAEAARLGFIACGIAPAGPVGEPSANALRTWIDEGMHDCMAYMANNMDKRLDPALLVPGARSIVAVALSYHPREFMPASSLRLSSYAYGRDYHDVMRERLAQLFAYLRILCGGTVGGRTFCDTAPVMERYWAWRAGLGWMGKHCNLIIPGAGSMVFLGEIVCDIELPPDIPMPSRCGNCTACLAACPTGALCAPHRLDARLCLSCQTIERRGALAPSTVSRLDGRIYGCDNCQTACPWNRDAAPTTIEEFAPSPELMSMTPSDWERLDETRYRRLFKGSAVKRAKYAGLMRNIRAALHGDCGGDGGQNDGSTV